MKKSTIAILAGAIAVAAMGAYAIAGFATQKTEEDIEFVRTVELEDDGDYYYVETDFGHEYCVPAKDTIIRVDTRYDDAWLNFKTTEYPLFNATKTKIELVIVIKIWRGL